MITMFNLIRSRFSVSSATILLMLFEQVFILVGTWYFTLILLSSFLINHDFVLRFYTGNLLVLQGKRFRRGEQYFILRLRFHHLFLWVGATTWTLELLFSLSLYLVLRLWVINSLCCSVVIKSWFCPSQIPSVQLSLLSLLQQFSICANLSFFLWESPWIRALFHTSSKIFLRVLIVMVGLFNRH
jgi:hypothetical protein